MSIKFLVLWGGFGGGRSADFIFMGARIFLIKGYHCGRKHYQTTGPVLHFLVFRFPWFFFRFSLEFPWFSEGFSHSFPGFSGAWQEQKILGIFGVFLGFRQKTKEKKDRVVAQEPNQNREPEPSEKFFRNRKRNRNRRNCFPGTETGTGLSC